jgi:DNA-binding NtrC family response regulator
MGAKQARIAILVIDDEAAVRESMKNMLERKGYRVFTAEDGVEGLQQVRDHAIDIIYSDILMPRMDGLKFLENVRQYNLRAEIIMITGSSTVGRCVEAIEKNACDYLTKPVTVKDILESIKKAERRVKDKKKMFKTAYAAAAREKNNRP